MIWIATIVLLAVVVSLVRQEGWLGALGIMAATGLALYGILRSAKPTRE